MSEDAVHARIIEEAQNLGVTEEELKFVRLLVTALRLSGAISSVPLDEHEADHRYVADRRTRERARQEGISKLMQKARETAIGAITVAVVSGSVTLLAMLGRWVIALFSQHHPGE